MAIRVVVLFLISYFVSSHCAVLAQRTFNPAQLERLLTQFSRVGPKVDGASAAILEKSGADALNCKLGQYGSSLVESDSARFLSSVADGEANPNVRFTLVSPDSNLHQTEQSQGAQYPIVSLSMDANGQLQAKSAYLLAGETTVAPGNLPKLCQSLSDYLNLKTENITVYCDEETFNATNNILAASGITRVRLISRVGNRLVRRLFPKSIEWYEQAHPGVYCPYNDVGFSSAWDSLDFVDFSKERAKVVNGYLDKDGSTNNHLINNLSDQVIVFNGNSSAEFFRFLDKQDSRFIVIFAHCENGYMEIRIPGKLPVKVSILEIAEYARKSQKFLFPLGCKTARLGNLGTVIDIDSYKMARRLEAAFEASISYKDFFSILASPDSILVFNSNPISELKPDEIASPQIGGSLKFSSFTSEDDEIIVAAPVSTGFFFINANQSDRHIVYFLAILGLSEISLVGLLLRTWYLESHLPIDWRKTTVYLIKNDVDSVESTKKLVKPLGLTFGYKNFEQLKKSLKWRRTKVAIVIGDIDMSGMSFTDSEGKVTDRVPIDKLLALEKELKRAIVPANAESLPAVLNAINATREEGRNLGTLGYRLLAKTN